MGVPCPLSTEQGGCVVWPDPSGTMGSLIMNESNFQHILRVLNTNLDGKVKVMFALTSIKGVGRRFSNVACKKAEVDLNKRAGELPAEEVERLVTIVQNPRQFKVPYWMLNRKKDVKDGKYTQCVSNTRHEAARRPGADEEDPR